MLVLGVQARWVVIGLTPALLGAINSVQAGSVWVFTAPNGGREYPAFLLAARFVHLPLGVGISAYAVEPSAIVRQRPRSSKP